jgi:hypothetical protein
LTATTGCHFSKVSCSKEIALLPLIQLEAGQKKNAPSL